MFFNSLDFAIFSPIIFLSYWFVFGKNIKNQNILLLVSSYIFYGWWDWRFLSLIAFSSFVDYFVSIKMDKSKDGFQRKVLLWISILVNLGFLGFFKYYNFFAQSFADAFTLFGNHIDTSSLNIVLPVGISFYTFQTLSYSIDVYKKKLQPTKNIIAFFAFVSFFPQLVAGPIERATNLLPQFLKEREFNYLKAVDGSKQILWGLFKKMVIADNCAYYANIVFNNSEEQAGSTLILGALFFTFQIYGDFSGYSDIAIGTSRLFGFNLLKNFSFPYFSRDIAEFWRRWHISLSTWFRDYLYIPLGGSRGSIWMKIRNTFIIFIVSGFWHGANWTFIVWGMLNALFFMPLLIFNKNRANIDVIAKGKSVPSLNEFINMIITFMLIAFAWIFFRADNLKHAFSYISGIFSLSVFSIPRLSKLVIIPIALVLIFLLIEWNGRDQEYAIAKTTNKWSKKWSWLFYYAIVISLILFQGKEQDFIYFQF